MRFEPAKPVVVCSLANDSVGGEDKSYFSLRKGSPGPRTLRDPKTCGSGGVASNYKVAAIVRPDVRSSCRLFPDCYEQDSVHNFARFRAVS
jgi:hypothetical protein